MDKAVSISNDNHPGADRGKKCPICGKPQLYEFRPFCSQRCKDVDLNRWLAGRYAISASVEEEEE